MLWSVALAVSAAPVVLGQRPARIGPTANPCSTDPSWKNVKRGSLTCNGADTIISCRGGNPGTNLRIGTGSTAVTFAGIDAWTWSASTLPENTSYLLLSLVKKM